MNITVSHCPDITEPCEKAILFTRISSAVTDIFADKYNEKQLSINVHEAVVNTSQMHKTKYQRNEEPDEGAGVVITASEPSFTLDQMVLPDEVRKELLYAVQFESVRSVVYEDWHLKEIDPSPKLALNFHGDSGTGKTMAAHALAHAMGKKIMLASYAEIESKYHGDGPKNVKNIFKQAADTNAVLFIDEADSLLSKRLTNVSQGSEQAINSMRSQLLIEIEKFSGTVIFATNLAVNYDSAFITRIRSIHFVKPDKTLREQLWRKMLLPQLPLADDIQIDELAQIDNVCGRDIKNAVIKAAVQTAIDGESAISQKQLVQSVTAIVAANKEIHQSSDVVLTDKEKKEIKRQARKQRKTRRYETY